MEIPREKAIEMHKLLAMLWADQNSQKLEVIVIEKSDFDNSSAGADVV